MSSSPEQQQALADALFDSIGQGAISTDKNGKIDRINKAALDLLGCTKDEMMGRWFPEAIVAEDENGLPLPTLERPIIQSFLTGRAVDKDIFYRRSDGEMIPVSVTVSPIMFNSLPIGAVEVFRNISHDLEVDRMKTEFIYLASHQLRTPLTAIKTYAHMLSDGYRGELTKDQKVFMNTMLTSLDRMNDIISTLLNVSRIEAGKLSYIPLPVLLNELVEDSLKELKPAIRAKQLKVSLHLNGNPTIETDQILAKEVCLNLISNAIKYTPQAGKISITVKATAKEQLIIVKDTGFGIPDESKTQLFSKFYRAPNVVDSIEAGTGLGLYLVKGVAEALGGRVWFKSKLNEGSEFYFALPTKPPFSKEVK